MEIKVFTEQGRVSVTVMHVDGDLDSSTYTDFQSKAEEAIKAGARHILVDFSHTKFVSSAGLRAINNIFNKLRALDTDSKLSEDELHKNINAGTYKSPHIKLLNLSEATQTAFELSGFDMYIETFTDMQKAVASF